MWNEIAAWQERLCHRPDLSAKTIALYTQDARRFATWLQGVHSGARWQSDEHPAYRVQSFWQTDQDDGKVAPARQQSHSTWLLLVIGTVGLSAQFLAR